MKISGAAGSDAMLLGVGAVVLVGLFLFLKKQGAAAVGALANVNAGTPYQGAGVTGTLGNATNTLSGGLLAGVGSWLGSTLADITMPYDPNAAAPVLQTNKQAVGDNFYNTTDFGVSQGW